MKISARNQFKGRIRKIVNGIVTANLTVDIGGGNTVMSVISMEAVEDLKLKKGGKVTVVIKSTDVMLAVDD